MRASLIIVLAFAVGVIATTTTKTRNYSRLLKHRARPRVNRGINYTDLFVPATSGIAYGFGKRQNAIDASKMLDEKERILTSLLRYSPQSIPVEWLIQQMKTNPVLAAKLTQLLMYERANLMTMVDHSNPARTNWLY